MATSSGARRYTLDPSMDWASYKVVEDEVDDCVELICTKDSVEVIEISSNSEIEEDPSEVSITVTIILAFYYLLRPHVPTYNIDYLNLTTFDIHDDNKLYSEVGLIVNAENQNEIIGLEHDGENRITIMYSGSQLCSGNFTPFLQPGKNTTKINVVLKGQVGFDQEMQQDLMQHNKEGNIPLLIMVKAPIRLVIDEFIHLKKFVVNVNCSLVVDHLQPHQNPKILKKDVIMPSTSEYDCFSYQLELYILVAIEEEKGI
ncbi:PREDICTED: uncharacterized protein LOC109337170 [Lupinus angustifolius]|uniref:uncharacterized protein LOC109337170 n=1 Tax=Lupinus angustifolius TaxID=3871 RepID=UPI00092E26FC|nr:PREDICTED: uncharacterized protein LOC109337170 [Lupinus angustifolius]